MYCIYNIHQSFATLKPSAYHCIGLLLLKGKAIMIQQVLYVKKTSTGFPRPQFDQNNTECISVLYITMIITLFVMSVWENQEFFSRAEAKHRCLICWINHNLVTCLLVYDHSVGQSSDQYFRAVIWITDCSTCLLLIVVRLYVQLCWHQTLAEDSETAFWAVHLACSQSLLRFVNKTQTKIKKRVLLIPKKSCLLPTHSA